MHGSLSSDMESLYGMIPPDSGSMGIDWEPSPPPQPLPLLALGQNTGATRPQLQLDLPAEWSNPTGMQSETELSSSSSDRGRTDSHHAPDERASSGSPCTRGQSCLASLFQLALDLHIAHQICTTANSSIPGSLAEVPALHTPSSSSDSSTRGVDSVLLQNREAIHLLSQTLECPCSSELSVTLAAYLVASKIVAWYGAILGINDSTSSSVSDQGYVLNPSMAGRIVARPILMGTYSLDAKVHRSIRARVVVSELSVLVEPLLAKLPHFKQPTSSFEQKCGLRDQMRMIIGEANKLVMR